MRTSNSLARYSWSLTIWLRSISLRKSTYQAVSTWWWRLRITLYHIIQTRNCCKCIHWFLSIDRCKRCVSIPYLHMGCIVMRFVNLHQVKKENITIWDTIMVLSWSSMSLTLVCATLCKILLVMDVLDIFMETVSWWQWQGRIVQFSYLKQTTTGHAHMFFKNKITHSQFQA